MSLFSYDIAISFAGEQRREAEGIANCLRASGLKVFCDEYEQATLWGKDLYEHLAKVYQHEAQYCLMLVSAAYAAKVWTTHERRSAQARALTEKADYVLPVRFDDTEIPGLLPSVAYLRFEDHGVPGICARAIEKIRGISTTAATSPLSITTSPRVSIIDAERKLQAWVPVVECTWGKTEATLLVQPDDPTDGPFLDNLRGTSQKLLIAFKNNAAACRVEDVQHVVKDADERWMIILRIESTDFTTSIEMGMGGMSADEIAEHRASRILLNEFPARDTSDVNDAVREVFLRGMGTTQQVTASPFPALYQRYGSTPARFLEIAWITGAMTLKTSGVVVEVTTLKLALDRAELRVNFEGKRRKQYTNQPPTTVAVAGICRLG